MSTLPKTFKVDFRVYVSETAFISHDNIVAALATYEKRESAAFVTVTSHLEMVKGGLIVRDLGVES